MVDTNVVVSAFLAPTGVPAQILEAWRQGIYDLLVSEPILQEYGRVLRYRPIWLRHGMNEAELSEVIEGFRHFAVPVEPTGLLHVVKEDPDDDKFLECAAAGEAAYIVSGDTHLLRLREYQGIPIVTPAVFLVALKQEEHR